METKGYNVLIKLYIEETGYDTVDIELKVKLVPDIFKAYEKIIMCLNKCQYICCSKAVDRVINCAIKYVQSIKFTGANRRNIEYTLGKYIHENDIRYSGSVKQFKLNATIRESKDTR